MHARIFLIGFMGAGKTTQGKQIARMMGYDFIDMDRWITEREKKSIPQIFEQKGESYFRQLESAAIDELRKRNKVVIATGGGAPCHNGNMERMKNAGLTIYLKLAPGALLVRLQYSKTKRPLLEGKNEQEMLHTIQNLLQQREPFYSQAHMVIDGLDRVNERIVNAIQRR